jgi:antitoxin component of MazEF toxin-antitoxin module
MGYPTTIQLIARIKGNQWYVNFPNALAKALDFEKGEVVEWEVVDKMKLVLKRTGTTDKLGERERTDAIPIRDRKPIRKKQS